MGSWLKCPCGNNIHKNMFCGENVYRLIEDGEYDALPEAATRHEIDLFVVGARDVLRCKKCGRLFVEWEHRPGHNNFTVYIEEQIDPPSSPEST